MEEQNVPRGSQPSGNELNDGEASLHLGNVSQQAGPTKRPVGWANPGRASAEAEENPRTSEETQEIQETQRDTRVIREAHLARRSTWEEVNPKTSLDSMALMAGHGVGKGRPREKEKEKKSSSKRGGQDKGVGRSWVSPSNGECTPQWAECICDFFLRRTSKDKIHNTKRNHTHITIHYFSFLNFS